MVQHRSLTPRGVSEPNGAAPRGVAPPGTPRGAAPLLMHGLYHWLAWCTDTISQTMHENEIPYMALAQ